MSLLLKLNKKKQKKNKKNKKKNSLQENLWEPLNRFHRIGVHGTSSELKRS